MSKQIIAIGGGGFTDPEKDYKLERYLLSLISKESPNVCFLPQASNESNEYIVKFYESFTAMKAKPSWISLFGRVEPTWKDLLMEQDLIYVGGGNTRSMLALWKEWGMDKVLKEAYQQGTILAGVSAGAICWFEECITDSVWPLGSIKGLGFLKGSCCPHYDSEPERKPTFLKMVNGKEIIPGIALEDYSAAHYIDGMLHKVVISRPNKKAYLVSENNEKSLETVSL